MALITLCLIVKNEAHCLARCLQQALPLADDCVVVDTGSTDDTAAIARDAGARVVPFTWVNDFSAARNESLRHATGDWCLVIDADEMFSVDDPAAFRAWVRGLPAAVLGAVFPRVNHAEQGEHFTTWDDEVIRLFRRRDDLRFQRQVHESVEPSLIAAGGTLARAPYTLQHYGFLRGEGYAAKSRSYEKLLRGMLDRDPGNNHLLYVLAGEMEKQGRYAEEGAALRASFATAPPARAAAVALNLGILHAARLHDIPQALHWLRRAESALPDSTLRERDRGELHLNLSKCLLLQGDTSAAAEAFARALPLLGDHPDALRHGVAVYDAAQRPEKTVYLLRRLIALQDHPDDRYALALRYLQLNNHAAAKQSLAELLQRCPGHEKAQKIFRKL